jgi:hypothetical protein
VKDFVTQDYPIGRKPGDTPINRTAKCPHCGQTMPAIRSGVKLTPVPALIYDRVRLVGAEGISGRELRNYLLDITGRENVSRALNTRVHQLNKMIDAAGLKIVCRPDQEGRLRTWRYFLIRI